MIRGPFRTHHEAGFPLARVCGLTASLWAFLLLGGMAGCRPPAPAPARFDPDRFDGRRAWRDVQRFVAIGPRPAGSPGAAAGAEFIRSELRAAGVEARVDEFTDATPSGPMVFRNVLGRIPGTADSIVMLACHYDTKAGIAGFVGANDSGSGVGVLLEMARALPGDPAGRPDVLLAFLDGEECQREYGPRDGFHGSRRLASQWQEDGRIRRLRAFILLDMVGDRDLSVTIPRNGTPWLISAVFTAAEAEGCRKYFSLHRSEILDDHVAFLAAGVPAVDLIDFEYGSAPGRNDYWHTREDSLDKIGAESLQRVGRVVIRVLNTLF